MFEPAADAWRGEEWARRVAGLDRDERARRIMAASAIMENGDDISDGLYSELVLLLEALRDPNPSAGGDREG